ncbi:MAG: SDR family NAD(P)-dependent oxidoreductase [Planctomycetota bacterium]|nr:MAG: SDR family NAD(P)-dependent oxidoreductase [Planctomycetota bacterium]
MAKKILVTGGTGFLGSALVVRLVREGHTVRVLDNQSRGAARRIAEVIDDVELIEADIRDAHAVSRATKAMESVVHLAYVNGTEFFYTMPQLVLDVAVRGMINVLDACVEHDVADLSVASSSEVYQSPPEVPTDETTPLSVPDPLNPRYSYGGGKIISELMALNWGREHFERVVVFRPHNVFGPDMGWEHVVPQFAVRMKQLCDEHTAGIVAFPIQGSGRETRSFVYIEDFTNGLLKVIEQGEHRNIYNIGTTEELSIAQVAQAVGACFGRDVEIVPGALTEGSTLRRCPDIGKLECLGYRPAFTFRQGLTPTVEWYAANSDMAPKTTEPSSG